MSKNNKTRGTRRKKSKHSSNNMVEKRYQCVTIFIRDVTTRKITCKRKEMKGKGISVFKENMQML